MSYDVHIGGESFNYTYNLAPLFYAHIPDMGKGGGLNELNGVTGKSACRILSSAFESINSERSRLWINGAIGEPEFCAKYDVKNGWGSLVGALCFLALILGACAGNRRSRVTIS